MKFIYPVVLTPAAEGGYDAAFPDLEGCLAFGATLDEALEKAQEAANDWITVELSEEVPEMPPVSELSDLTLEAGQIARNIMVTIRLFDGWDE